MGNIRVGVGVCIINDGKFLVGKRLSKHGTNTYAFPGGHMELGEHWFDTAKRETKEETNLEINNMKLLGITNDIFKDTDKHYITIFVTAQYEHDELINLEKEKCSGWDWITIEELNENRFLALDNLLNSEFKDKLVEELEKSKIKKKEV